MKRLFCILVSLLMAMSLVGCGSGSGGGSGTITSNDYNYVFTADPKTFDYVMTQDGRDFLFLSNMVDGLVETDSECNYIGALAESWESNDDATVWTFHLRKGARWVTSEGEDYAEVVAQDFVTGLQHAADFGSSTSYLVNGIIKNFLEYRQGTVTFDQVGVAAPDDYTVVYTLAVSCPYFYSLGNYGILWPINQEFLESKGTGCKLGAPDKSTCSFGSVDPTSILYNGAYIMSNFTSKSVVNLKKNESYWDKDHVYINNASWMYDNGSDDHGIINGFESGNYSWAELKGTWSTEDFQNYLTKYADNAYLPITSPGTYCLYFNFLRRTYSDQVSDADKANRSKAMQDVNFRLALMFGWDKLTYSMQTTGEKTAAQAALRSEFTPSAFVTVGDQTYGEAVTDLIQAEDGFEKVSAVDGTDTTYDPAKSLDYIEKAKADGVSFPVTLDIPCLSTNSDMINRYSSLKQSVAASTNNQININMVMISSDDEYQNMVYSIMSGEQADFDLFYETWSPDYNDMKSYLNVISPVNGDMLLFSGLNSANSGLQTAADIAAAKAAGLYEYQELLDAADSILTDLPARYKAYTKAEAYLVTHALLIPVMASSSYYQVSKIVPFTREWSYSGCSRTRLKFMVIKDDIVTTKDYDSAKAEWEKKRIAASDLKK